jgi:hypothetical protein
MPEILAIMPELKSLIVWVKPVNVNGECVIRSIISNLPRRRERFRIRSTSRRGKRDGWPHARCRRVIRAVNVRSFFYALALV